MINLIKPLSKIFIAIESLEEGVLASTCHSESNVDGVTMYRWIDHFLGNLVPTNSSWCRQLRVRMLFSRLGL